MTRSVIHNREVIKVRRHNKERLTRFSGRLCLFFVLCASFASSGCLSDIEGELYYGRVTVPTAQEFRWSDGGLPQVFDPALAAAAPDTDAVRAMFEGLTEYDTRTLAPVSGVALRWESSDADRTWTFYLRRDAKWSNGDKVTAEDFVRSWRRVVRLGEQSPHAQLLSNIEGAIQPGASEASTPNAPSGEPPQGNNNAGERTLREPDSTASAPAIPFGATAVDDYKLQVRLLRPDKNFPALVAHPVFRPVHEMNEGHPTDESATFEDNANADSDKDFITNGAFVLSSRATNAVVLERARNYWDARTVKLERVRFVGTRNAEDAVAAYHAGEIDAVSNAAFEPLALKLLAPYKDFRRATFGAVTYYRFNTNRPPFDNLKVRQAFALAIDRNRLSRDVMGGATEPATSFLPKAEAETQPEISESPVGYDVARARALLAEAGFAGGRGLPRVKLLVNRNDQQRVLAESVAAMWRSGLNVETEVVIRSWEDYEAAFSAGDYDIARRSLVMQTTDETTNLFLMFGSREKVTTDGAGGEGQAKSSQDFDKQRAAESANDEQLNGRQFLPSFFDESQALAQLPAVPISFASSYALVKPYVLRHDANLLDIQSLKNISIDTAWSAPRRDAMIRVQRAR